ncbi:MAG: helix-turn-helix transcriptional regulator [Clostridia bacterium]|nr:helix-turn-helix transcriptional regulator [Clostridia bacterium]
MQTFGEQLTVARKAKGMTQEALAQAADISRSTISSWERGRTIPDYDSVRRLSEILDYDFSQTAEGQSAAPAVEDAAVPEEQAQDASTLPNIHFSHGGGTAPSPNAVDCRGRCGAGLHRSVHPSVVLPPECARERRGRFQRRRLSTGNAERGGQGIHYL